MGRERCHPGHVPKLMFNFKCGKYRESVDPQWLRQGDGDHHSLQGDRLELSEGTVRRVFGQNTHTVWTSPGEEQLEAATCTVDSPGTKSSRETITWTPKPWGTFRSGSLEKTSWRDTAEAGTVLRRLLFGPRHRRRMGAGRWFPADSASGSEGG